jgi:predicted porin
MNGTATTGKDTLSTRNSYLGLAGGFGTVLMGSHDTPFKMFGRKFDVFGDTVADNRQLLNPLGAVDARPENVLAYITPNFNGFGGAIAYVSSLDVSGEDEDTTGQTDAGADNNKSSAYSLSGTYANGPIEVGMAYQVLTIKDAADVNEDPSVFRLGGSFTTGPMKVGAMYQMVRDVELELDDTGTTYTGLERNDYTLFGTYAFGMNTIKLAYTYVGEIDSDDGTVDDTDASLFALGLEHKFSKRTTGYVQYTMLANGKEMNLGLGDNSGYGNPVDSDYDKSPSAFSVGLIHNF